MSNTDRTDASTARWQELAADMFHNETRRGYLANSEDPNITEQGYVERFLEQNKGRDIDKLEEIADIVRPSSSLTAYEAEQYLAEKRTTMGRSS